ncbi:PREDICTED: protein sidekick-1, partial [Tinamus guttatus]|uniref:protein sidekick-1 n=1 Tax=Tinamus guttatus TaxID=94827 RepID=UPI00052EB182
MTCESFCGEETLGGRARIPGLREQGRREPIQAKLGGFHLVAVCLGRFFPSPATDTLLLSVCFLVAAVTGQKKNALRVRVNTSTKCIDLGGDCNTARRAECCCQLACKVGTNQRLLGNYGVGPSVSPRLRGRGGGRCSQVTKGSPAAGRGRSSDQRAVSSGGGPSRTGTAIFGRKVDRGIAARRNSWADGVMIKLNLCSFFCRGWWAFLLLQVHMLQALAQDDVAPYFKTEPGLPQIHLEGNRLVLTCLAEGSWPLEFKWLRNDSEITNYSTEYKYIIPALQRSDAGFYQCVVRNRMGALLQRRSEVQVAYMGNFVDANQRKTVTEGEAAVLNFLHIFSHPRPQVTWFRDGHKIIPSNR